MTSVSSSLSNHSYDPQWEKRFSSLKPYWYQTKKVARVAAVIFANATLVFGTATVYASIAFTATPAVIIGTVAALSVLTVACAIMAIVCMKKSTFWSDPRYHQEQAQKLWNTIISKDMTYPQIQSTYKEVLQDHAWLNNDDYNHIVSKDVDYYDRFIARHGKEMISLLNEANRKTLSEAFVKKVFVSPFTFNTFVKDYSVELLHLDIPHQQLNKILDSEITHGTYANFKAKNSLAFSSHAIGRGHVAYKLSPQILEKLKTKAVDELSSVTGSIFINDHSLLGLTQDEFLTLLVPAKAAFLINRPSDYQAIISEIPVSYFKYLTNNQIDDIKKLFITHIASLNEGILSLARFKEDLNAFNLSENEFNRQILIKEADLLEKGTISYPQFMGRNGKDSLTQLSPGDLDVVKKVFVKYCLEFDGGFEYFLKHFQEDIKLLNLSNDELAAAIVPQQFSFLTNEKISGSTFITQNGSSFFKYLKEEHWHIIQSKLLQENQLNYQIFRSKNGPEVIQKLASYPLLKNFFKNKFLENSYQVFIAAGYQLDRDYLGITDKDLSEKLKSEAESLSYIQFVNKHGSSVLQNFKLVDASLRQTLREKFLAEHLGDSYETIQFYKSNFSSLGITDQHMRALIEADISGLNFHSFQSKHGLNPIRDKILTDREILKFRNAFLSSLKGRAYGEILAMRQEIQVFDITPQEIEDSIKSDVSTLSYDKFKAKHGLQAIQKGLLDPSLKTILREKFLANLAGLHYHGILNHKEDFQSLDVRNEHIQALMEADASKLSYSSFTLKHGLDPIKDKMLTPQRFSQYRNEFLTTLKDRGYEEIISYREIELFTITSQEIENLIKPHVFDLSYNEFKAKHGLKAIQNGLLRDETETLIEKLKDAIKASNQPHNYKVDCQLLHLNWREALEHRWDFCHARDILKKDKSLFLQSMHEGVFSAQDWATKFKNDLQNESAESLFTNHRELFKNGVLRTSDFSNRFENDINRFSTLESFLAQYSDDVFNEGLLAKNSPRLKKLLVEYMLRNFNLVSAGTQSDSHLNRVRRLGFMPQALQNVLEEAQRKYAELQNKNRELNSRAESQYTSTLKSAKTKQQDHVESEKIRLSIPAKESEVRQLSDEKSKRAHEIDKLKSEKEKILNKRTYSRKKCNSLNTRSKNRKMKSNV